MGFTTFIQWLQIFRQFTRPVRQVCEPSPFWIITPFLRMSKSFGFLSPFIFPQQKPHLAHLTWYSLSQSNIHEPFLALIYSIKLLLMSHSTTSAQSDQSSVWAWQSLGSLIVLRAHSGLIQLGRCPIWSESSLVAQVILFVLSCCGSFFLWAARLEINLIKLRHWLSFLPPINYYYCKNPKNSNTRKICCNHPKIWTRWLYHRVMYPKVAGSIANCVFSDQTADLGLHCLPRPVCPKS